jgi:hypothetical protein
MKWVYTLVIAVYFVVAGWVVCYDLSHPELWTDWRHDVRWHGPAMAAVVLIYVAFVIYAVVNDNRNKRR